MRKVIVGNDKVFIGRLGDDDVREFAFDLSEYTSCMDGEFSVSCLFVLPNKSDSEAYAIAIDHYRLEGNQLIWIPTNAECSETGWGKFEAILYNEGQQIASIIWRVQVGKSLVGDEEPPEGWENYILAVERLVDRIEDMTATASVDNTTGTPSVTVTKTEDPLNLDFAFHNIKGAKGDKGDTGSKGETGNGIVSIVKTGTSGLVDTYTITYDNGDTDTFTVTNGEKGDKGDTGATPDIYTTAVTLAEGSSAYAHVSGTIEQPLITFGIPKGDTGAQPPLSDDLPLMDGTASAGTDTEASRSDHVHPHDVSLLPVDSVSGNPLSISDGFPVNAKGLSVALEPIQDLHGYDAPWPAGGGKNLWGDIVMANDMARTVSARVDITDKTVSLISGGNENNMTDGVVFKENTQYTFIFDGVVSQYANLMFSYTDGTNDRTLGRYFSVGANVSAPNKTVAGLYKRSYSNTTVIYYEKAGLFEGALTASQFTPYANICPITGRDEVSVVRTGKNFIPPIPYPFNSNQLLVDYGREITFNGYTISMLFSGSFANEGASFIVGTDNEGKYTMLIPPQNFKTLAGNVSLRANTTYTNEAVKYSTSEVVKVKQLSLRMWPAFTGLRCDNVMLNQGSTATAYKPYQSVTVTVPFEDTVYGGTVDVVNGVLTVDRAIVDLGMLTWTYQSSQNRFFSSGISSTVKAPVNNASLINAICSQYIYRTLDGLGIYDSGCAVSNTKNVYVKDGRYSDVASFTQAMSGVQFCYELATPITVTLTPQDLMMLLGNNVITSDGTITLDYYCDVTKYIAKKIAEVQALILEG